MKPKRILIVRHGEAAHNVDRNVLKDTPDYAIPLTENGVQQAVELGKMIAEKFGSNFLGRQEKFRVYCSPYWRTRQTAIGLSQSISFESYTEHPDLREQEWGSYIEDQADVRDKLRDDYGHFYFRHEGGESGADVYSRTGNYLDDFFNDAIDVYPPDTSIFVTHGYTSRILLMHLLGLSVEEFEIIRNPGNATFYHLEQYNYEYKLMNELRKYPKHKHDKQFDWKGIKFPALCRVRGPILNEQRKP